MIKIVAIKTVILKISCASKTWVHLFQLIYVVTALVIIMTVDKSVQHLFYICTFILFLLFILRLTLKWFPSVCGECGGLLAAGQGTECPECESYNVYDLSLWSKLKFKNVKVAHRAEIGRFVQNVIALTVVLGIFSMPFLYLIFVVDEKIHLLNQQRRIAFVQIRPAFLKYKENHGKYPVNLEKLAPNYINKIPSVLINKGKKSHESLKINYQTNEETAQFIFHISHAPISVMRYDIGKNLYRSESRLSVFLHHF